MIIIINCIFAPSNKNNDMDALEKYFEILFTDTQFISRRRRAIGALKNIQAMTADPHGVALNPNIAASQTKLNTYNTCLNKIDTDSGFKEGETIDLDGVDAQLYLELRISEHVILSKVAKTSAIYHQFFPEGLSESAHLTRENTPIILNRMIVAAGHNAVLFPTLAGIYTTLQTNWNLARTAQTGGMGGLSVDMMNFLDALLALCIQLTDNVADIGKLFRGNIPKAMSYFDEPSFYGPNHHIHKHRNGVIAALAVVNAYQGVYTVKTHIQLKVKTAGVNVQIVILTNLTDPILPTDGKHVNGVGAHTWLASEISAVTTGYVVLISLNPTDPGQWELDVID